MPKTLENRISFLEKRAEQQSKKLLELESLLAQSRQQRKLSRVEQLVGLVKQKGELDANELIQEWKISRTYALELIGLAEKEKGVFVVHGGRRRPTKLLALTEKNRLVKISEDIHAEFEKRGLKSASTNSMMSSYSLSNSECEEVIRLLLRKQSYRIERPKGSLGNSHNLNNPKINLRRMI